jgi:DNA gyrase subunit A
MTFRFSLRPHRDPSTRSGRRYARLKKDDEVVYVDLIEDEDAIACATKQGRALIAEAEDISILAGPGRGVMLIKLQKDDFVIGAQVLADEADALLVKREGGSDYKISLRKYDVVSRGGKGFQLFKRGKLDRVVFQEPTLPGFPAPEEG